MHLETCPNCGADVPPDAKSCPDCGSCDATGWSDSSQVDGLDIPEESFDYDEFVQREFGPKKALPRGISPFWWVVTIGVVLALLSFILRLWG
ncbi:MAG: zinc ribbon domain-containing protein [Verrucomicrobia bacterium]|nr:zinc ribbon domain-containing protein [Verrucomicrobiota bacterium]